MVSDNSIRSISKILKVRLSRDAKEELKDFIKIYSLKIAKLAVEISKTAKRKTVRKEDVLLAIK
jgi:histone H3/H4